MFDNKHVRFRKKGAQSMRVRSVPAASSQIFLTGLSELGELLIKAALLLLPAFVLAQVPRSGDNQLDLARSTIDTGVNGSDPDLTRDQARIVRGTTSH